MKIRFKRLKYNAQIPKRQHPTDAGYDLYITRKEWDAAERKITYHTDLAVEIPLGYVGLVFPRSSIHNTDLTLTNCVGVIDSGYRGEITGVFKVGEKERIYYEYERFAQLVIVKHEVVEFEESDELSESDRGEGGYGSTGR